MRTGRNGIMTADAKQLCDDIIDLTLDLRRLVDSDSDSDSEGTDVGEPVSRWPMIGAPSGA